MVGGLLVAVAAVALYGVASVGAAPERQQFVVATAALPAGTRVSSADVTTIEADLPPGTLEHVYRDAADDGLIGGVLLGPVAGGELLQRSLVRPAHDAGAGPPPPEFSLAIAPDRALAGDLRPGEQVDVLATYGTGSGASTMVIARAAAIRAVDGADRSTLASTGSMTVTLALGDPSEVIALAHASQVAAVTLVRTTGRPVEEVPGRYHTPLDAADDPGATAG